MSTKFFLNGHDFDTSSLSLPLLINGTEGSGASFFSVSFISDLILAGGQVIFFTSAKPAFDQLKTQIEDHSCYYLENVSQINDALEQDVIVVESGNKQLCENLLKAQRDRIVFIKNIETTINEEIFHLVRNNKKLILSGDVLNSDLSKEFLASQYDSIISFSELPSLDADWKSLEFRKAYLFKDYINQGTIDCA